MQHYNCYYRRTSDIFLFLLSEYICHNRKLNSTFSFRFRIKTCDVTRSLLHPLPHCHIFLEPILQSVMYFMDGPYSGYWRIILGTLNKICPVLQTC